MSDSLAEVLRRTRSERGQSQRDVALLLGVSLPMYHQWEAGSMAPNEAQLPAVAEYLGLAGAEVSEMANDEATAVASLRAELAAAQQDIAELRERLSALESQADRSTTA